MSLPRSRIGSTDLEVSRLGFGCAPLGDEYGSVDEAEMTRVVGLAIDRGVNFFDVAPYYGRTLAEERLGRALEGRRDEVVLATKCCRYDKHGFDFSAARVHADVDASLRRLRTDRLDLFHVHDVEFGDRAQILEETLPAMRAVQEAGKARYIGITGLPVHLLADLARSASVDAVLSYCHYNLLVRDLDTVLRPAAEERGFGLINASPLHMGILTDGGPPPWHPAPAEVQDKGRELAELCRSFGRDVAQVALRFALDYGGAASTLVGLRSAEELERNLSAFDAPVEPELLARIEAAVAPLLNRTWHEGLPENAPPG
ncbi:MAG: aldo/keto reductase [Planctomycetota bacterium]